MENSIRLDLTEQEARILIWTLRQMEYRVNGASAKRRRAKVLKARRKEYSKQRSLDAVLLAANGGRTNLLSGRSGELRKACAHFEMYIKSEEQKAAILLALAERVKIQMPERVEPLKD